MMLSSLWSTTCLPKIERQLVAVAYYDGKVYSSLSWLYHALLVRMLLLMLNPSSQIVPLALLASILQRLVQYPSPSVLHAQPANSAPCLEQRLQMTVFHARILSFLPRELASACRNALQAPISQPATIRVASLAHLARILSNTSDHHPAARLARQARIRMMLQTRRRLPSIASVVVPTRRRILAALDWGLAAAGQALPAPRRMDI